MAAKKDHDYSSVNHSPSDGIIVDLRKVLAERFPQPFIPSPSRLETGLPLIDGAIGGGLPKSSITELSSSVISGGSAFFIYALLEKARRDGYFLALVDGQDSFDPQPLGNRRLRHLLWVRCTQALEAVKAADLLLRDGNFPLVVLDLVLNSFKELRQIPQTSWYRLQRLVEMSPTAFLVLTRVSMISSAQLKLSLDNAWRIADLDQENLTQRLKILVKRAHGGREAIAGVT